MQNIMRIKKIFPITIIILMILSSCMIKRSTLFIWRVGSIHFASVERELNIIDRMINEAGYAEAIVQDTNFCVKKFEPRVRFDLDTFLRIRYKLIDYYKIAKIYDTEFLDINNKKIPIKAFLIESIDKRHRYLMNFYFDNNKYKILDIKGRSHHNRF